MVKTISKGERNHEWCQCGDHAQKKGERFCLTHESYCCDKSPTPPKDKGKRKELKEHQLCNCNDCAKNHKWCITHEKCSCEESPTPPDKKCECICHKGYLTEYCGVCKENHQDKKECKCGCHNDILSSYPSCNPSIFLEKNNNCACNYATNPDGTDRQGVMCMKHIKSETDKAYKKGRHDEKIFNNKKLREK